MAELFSEVPAGRGKLRGLWVRRAFVALFVGVAALALWGVFGQPERELTARGGGATMVVSLPDSVRGGLYFQSRIDITTTVAIEHPRLVFALLLGEIDGDDPLLYADLDGREPDAGRLVHGREHVVDQSAQFRVDGFHRFGCQAQSFVGDDEDISDRHDRDLRGGTGRVNAKLTP